MRLSGTVVGAGVHAFTGMTIVGGAAIQRTAIFFGIQHLSRPVMHDLEKANAPSGTDGKAFVPRWLEELANASGGGVGMTGIFVEMPPFSPEILETPEVAQIIGRAADPILSYTMTRLLPYFRQGGAARTKGWVLDGIDLRYQLTYTGGHLVKYGNDYRRSLHKNLPDDLAQQAIDLQVLRRAYQYLTGMSDDATRLQGLVTWYLAAAGHRDDDVKRGIFAQAAASCRTVYAGMDEGVKLSVVEHFVAEGERAAAKAATDLVANKKDTDYAVMYTTTPEAEYTQAVLAYAVAQHLVNVYMLGYVLTADADLRNVVIVIGQDHVMSLRRFFEEYRAVVRATTWPRAQDIAQKITLVEGTLQTTVDGIDLV